MTLRALLDRVETGRWPSVAPATLDRAADDLGPGYDLVFDVGTFAEGPMAPAFTRFVPARPQRPTS